jgi:hypothetical protein
VWYVGGLCFEKRSIDALRYRLIDPWLIHTHANPQLSIQKERGHQNS